MRRIRSSVPTVNKVPVPKFIVHFAFVATNVYLTYLRKEASRRSVSLTAKVSDDSASLEDALADSGPGPDSGARTVKKQAAETAQGTQGPGHSGYRHHHHHQAAR